MLQSRRAEEEASRAMRNQRRANTVAANNDMYKKRANAIRRRSMEEKLGMSSRKEQELFEELSALSKWRHVMYENIAHRERQHDDAMHLQDELRAGHLANVRRHEDEQFKEAVRDDKERFDSVLKATVEEKKNRVLATCKETVNDILKAVEDHIDFITHHDLDGTNAVPTILSSAIARKRAYPTDPDAVKKSLVQRHVDMSLYSAEVPPTDINNKLFVSLVQKMLHIQYPKPPPFKPKNPSSQPIVAIVGPKFSGKTTVAKAVAESLGLSCVADVDLIKMALAEFERDLTPSDISGETGAELLDLGREAQESLLSGKPISVDLLARLILYHLEHMGDSFNGIVLDGSPMTVAGYERLEQTLSGYDKTRITTIPDELLAPLLEDMNIDDPIFDVEKIDLSAIDANQPASGAKKDAKPAKAKGKKDADEDPLPPVDLPIIEPIPPLTEEEEEAIAACERDADVSSIHAVIHLDCSAEEIFRRFAGLRVDAETGRIYHLQMDPPPADRLPFLTHVDRTEASTAKLHKMVEHHMEEWSECCKWMNRYEGILHSIDAHKKPEELTALVTDVINYAAESAMAYHQRYCLAEEVRQRQVEMEQMFQERMANRETVRKQLAAIYLERGADLPAELLDPPKANEASLCTLPSNFTPLFLQQLRTFTNYYTSSVSHCHNEIQKLVNVLFEYGNTSEAMIDVFWQQPDPKQAALDAFVEEFNQMQPALRRDIQGKEELHLRAEQLTEQLFAMVERRREECNQLIEALHHRSTLTDNWSDAVRGVGIALIQTEVERFFTVRNLSLLYYSALRNEPGSIEDELLEFVPQLKIQTAETAVDPKAVAKDKKAPPPKKGGKGADEAAEKASEDIFTPAVEKALHAMKSCLDRLSASQASTQGKGAAKDKKGPAEVVAEAGPTPQGLCIPIVAAELEAAKNRITILSNFVRELVSTGLKRVESVRSKLMTNLRRKQIAQSSAVNSSVFEIRCAIEEERPVLFYLHLGSDTFNIDTTKALATMVDAVLSGVPFAGLAPPPESDVNVLSHLTRSRVMHLIRDFRIVAPHYDIYKQDFVLLVHPTDYCNSIQTEALPVATIFDRFDLDRCGAIDWRDFIVHLLFWCEPVNNDALFTSTRREQYGIDGPSLTQLFDMRADIGSEPLTHDEFIDTPFFFDADMEESRMMAYLDILWETFNVDGSVHPDTFLTFLCPDPQPLRGVQKAFVIAAAPGDESCAVKLDALDAVFHVSATCPRKMFKYDAHSLESLAGLFLDGAETIVFGDACKTHVGRVLFNSTKTFARKSFA